jgi:hypothetical protein
LRACAEAGVPDTIDLWPGIRESVDSSAVAEQRRLRRWRRFMPSTRVGWAFAALLDLLFSMGAYAATGLLYEMFRDELPGAQEPVVGEQLDITQRQAESGAEVTVEWAYADASYVVVGFNVKDLEEGRQVAGHPADLEPIVAIDEAGYERQIDAKFPERANLTDEDGNDFGVIDGGGAMSESPDYMMEGPAANTIVFAAQDKIEPGNGHHFHLEIPLQAYPIVSPEEKEVPPEPVGRPFVFDFEVPVRPAPVIKIDQKVEANGITLTLDRVVNSPGRPQAVVCFDPPDDGHRWRLGENVRMGGPLWFTYPFDGGLEHGPLSAYPDGYLGSTPAEKDRCHAVGLRPDRSGDYSFEVGQLEGWPESERVNGPEDIKKIRGPWRFDFEVPGAPGS